MLIFFMIVSLGRSGVCQLSMEFYESLKQNGLDVFPQSQPVPPSVPQDPQATPEKDDSNLVDEIPPVIHLHINLTLSQNMSCPSTPESTVSFILFSI